MLTHIMFISLSKVDTIRLISIQSDLHFQRLFAYHNHKGRVLRMRLQNIGVSSKKVVEVDPVLTTRQLRQSNHIHRMF